MSIGDFWNASEFLARAFTHQTRLIEPWMPPKSITLLFGPPSAGKTHLVTTLMCAMARGETLFERFACAECRVLLIEADMSNMMYQERLRAYPPCDHPNICFITTDAVSFDVLKVAPNDTSIAKGREFAPDIVIVDTLRKTHTLSENDSDSADRVYGAWRYLFPDSAFLFVHHTRKFPAQAAVAEVISREAFRGNIAWGASADTLLLLQRRSASETFRTLLTFVRTRGCAEPEPAMLKLTSQLSLAVTGATEQQFAAWMLAHPNADRKAAIAWLTEHDVSKTSAYRLWDKAHE